MVLGGERYKIGPWLPRYVNRDSLVTDRSVSFPMTLSDLERPKARMADFRNSYHLTKFGTWGRGVYFRGQPRPSPKGAGSSASQFGVSSTYAQTC